MSAVLHETIRASIQKGAASAPAPAMGQFHKIETITPDRAAQLLESSPGNRGESPAAIDRYADAMAAGKWRLGPSSLKIDVEGRLRDGHTRCWACIKAGVPFETWVLYNVTDEAIDVTDVGLKRTPAHILQFMGLGQSTWVAAALAWIGRIDHGETVKKALPAQRIKELLAENPDIVDVAKRGSSYHKICNTVPPGICLYFMMHAFRIDPEFADAFLTKLGTGIDIEAGSPILLIRNFLTNARHQRRLSDKLVQFTALAMLIKAWNLCRQGKTCRSLQFREGEAFPTML